MNIEELKKCPLVEIGAQIIITREEYETKNVAWLLIKLGFCESINEARRLTTQGAIKSKPIKEK